MELGVVKISSSLVALVVAGAIGWILLRFRYVPRAMVRLQAARGAEVPTASSHVVVIRSLSSLAISLVVAPILVALVYGYAQWRVEAAAGDPAMLQSLIQARALLESTLQPLTAISLEVWIVALVAASAIWIAARRSASRRSWGRALEARRRAHLASLSTLPDEELFAEADRSDPEAVARVLATATRIEARNREEIQKAETTRRFALGGSDGEEQLISITELRGFVADLEAHAAGLNDAAAHSQSGTDPEARAGE